MASIFSKFTRKSSGPRLEGDNEKALTYEGDRTRLSKTPPVILRKRGSGSLQESYAGSFAPNPLFIRALRFLLYGLTSLSALTTAGLGISVVQYYNSHTPVIKPSWGSLIACIVFGIGTPGVLFGLFLVTPHLFRHGGVGAILNQTRIELLMLFTMSVVWISGALAVACDLRGREYCLWDGYYHYPKPSDFDDVCSLINYTVALAYTTFGLAALQMSVVFSAAAYIILYLDQEALTEQTNDLGGRAYRARLAALAQYRSHLSAHQAGVSTAGPYSAAGEIYIWDGETPGPMSGGTPASRMVPRSLIDRPDFGSETKGGPMMAGGQVLDPERGFVTSQHDTEENEGPSGSGSGYYGYERAARV